MVDYDPENRPENIEAILQSEWMMEFNDLTILEQEVRNKFQNEFSRLLINYFSYFFKN